MILVIGDLKVAITWILLISASKTEHEFVPCKLWVTGLEPAMNPRMFRRWATKLEVALML